MAGFAWRAPAPAVWEADPRRRLDVELTLILGYLMLVVGLVNWFLTTAAPR